MPLFRQEAVDHRARGDLDGDGARSRYLRRARIPFIQQMTIAECGAACLAMLLGFHGRRTGVDEVRAILGPGRDGISAFDLIRAAAHFGLAGRGIKLELEELGTLERGTILHWGMAHFVVFDRARETSIEILDPMVGRRRVPLDEVAKQFTGVAIELAPTAAFSAGDRVANGAWAYARVLLRANRGLLVQVLLVSLAIQALALGVPIATGAIVDRVVPDHDEHLAALLAIGVVALVAVFLVTTLVRARILVELRARIDHRMSIGFVDHLVALPYAFFSVRSTGDLVQRWGSNTHIREVLTSGTLSAILDGALVGLYLVVLAVYSWSLGLVVLGLGAAQLAIFLLARSRKRELLAREIAADVRSQGYQIELLNGMETLKTLGAERAAAQHWSSLFVRVLDASIARSKFDAWIDVAIATVRFGSPLAVLVFGAAQVVDGELSLGRMLALSALAAGVLNPLATLVTTLMQLHLLGTHLERLDDVFRATPEQDPAKVSPAPRLSGAIALDDLAFRFSPTSPLVLDGITVRISPGQLVGIVGRSGAGKSTLAGLLAGIHRPVRGTIAYDDRDLAHLELRSVRAQLGIVTQDPYLFAATIRANIAMARPDAPLEDVERAARAAQIHDEIAAMPMGYDTVLVDRGASL